MPAKSWFTLSVLALCLVAPVSPARAQPDLAKLVLEAPLIFRGTVVGLATPTVPLASPNDRALRVRVDQTLRGASSVGDFTGQEIVVLRSKPSDRKEALFFVRPVAYGKTLATEEIGELAVPEDTEAFASQLARIEQQDAESKLLERIASAEAVVAGRVLAIRLDREAPVLPSEHAPVWVVAEVAVVRGLKGQPRVRECERGTYCFEVVFAQSDDIRWFRAPKLRVGQEAIFLLRPPARELLREGEVPSVAYVLIHPEDLRPLSEEPRLRDLINRNR